MPIVIPRSQKPVWKIFQKKQLHNCLQIAIISHSHQKAHSFIKILGKEKVFAPQITAY